MIAEERRLRENARLRALRAKNRPYYRAQTAAAMRRFRARNPAAVEKDRAYKQQWRVRNKSRIAAYVKRRRKAEPQFDIADRLRRRLNHAVANKAGHTIDLLGCSIRFFMAHIEHRFAPGMTWANRGRWHIDHIRPVAKFDLTDTAQQRACFHYSNLQPLWADENIRKHAR